MTAQDSPGPRNVDAQELLGLFDGEFVDALYRRILGREPDAQGRLGHLEQLRNGYPKAALIAHFLDSAEGRSYGAVVAGLETASTAARQDDAGLWRRWRDHPALTRETLARIEQGLFVLAAVQRGWPAQWQGGLAGLQQALSDGLEALRCAQETPLAQLAGRLDAVQAALLASLDRRFEELAAQVRDDQQQRMQQSQAVELALMRRLEAAEASLHAGLERLAGLAAGSAADAAPAAPPGPSALQCRLDAGLAPRAQIEALARQLAGTDEARLLARR
jgi:hypothetical protein